MLVDISTHIQEAPVMLSSISIDTRDYRSGTSEIWRIGGIRTTGEIVTAVGYITVTYRTEEEKYTFICGGISHAYDIAKTETEMWDILSSHFFGLLNIDETECFFAWRSGTVTHGWFHNAFQGQPGPMDFESEEKQPKTIQTEM